MDNEQIRLQKFLAEAGIASRRKCEQLILDGKISVNGQTVQELGTKIVPNVDKITYCGKPVENQENKVYILLNKPIGYVTTAKDQFNRDTVLNLVKVKERIVPVGRLDMYTSGALILTNDGEFVYKVTHPKHEITKTYTVTVKGIIQNEEVEKLKQGVQIEDYTTRPAKVRKMCESVGRKVLALHRSKIGNIGVKDLKLGTWRYMKKQEIESLCGQ